MRNWDTALALVFLLGAPLATRGEETPPRIDYMSFAQGALAVGAPDADASKGVGPDAALAAIDGSRAKYGLSRKTVARDGAIELVFELPAPTLFDRFAVPDVLETPSPAQTFVRTVEVLGSSQSASEGFVPLAKGDLVAGREGSEAELEILAKVPVRFVKLRLSGGLDVRGDEFFAEFSEIIGNGSQETVPLATGFEGRWKNRALRLELVQDGPVVSGCYDGTGTLEGTVSGNVLRATGVDRKTGVGSVFVMTVDPRGEIRGVRSTNGAPFRAYDLATSPAKGPSECAPAKPNALGCGSLVHGIGFDFDSARIRPESEAVLARLYEGLAASSSSRIVIEGHTSNEGSEAYNRELSAQRARAVVDDLVRRGIDPARIRATGKGETEPIATNDDEAGRSLNRRVEIVCDEKTSG